MQLGTALAVYFLIWWLTLFAVLPFGVRSQQEGGEIVPGSDPGAPAVHRVWNRLLWTTGVSAVIFAILYVAYARDWIPYEFLSRISSPPARP